ncbi:RecF/RecN/SMC protein [Hesseltinella vesiculosa]|uniref:Structural maintenance of chromosomes protein n=1 Tax=Hesseltinella vesiculosa TaxID=101127 RepID=A0A1X2GSD3_9FUNG|nr:RecF/RecN/SMC protein [Hesseltinella vesiculosa]
MSDLSAMKRPISGSDDEDQSLDIKSDIEEELSFTRPPKKKRHITDSTNSSSNDDSDSEREDLAAPSEKDRSSSGIKDITSPEAPSKHSLSTSSPATNENEVDVPADVADPERFTTEPADLQPAKETPAPSKPVKKPRLVITKMVLRDFKSYAGRQVIGPFHKSFSAVVGPNGSGKSNVIDALLFVFGYRATKMRQGKLSELIHNSAKHPNVQNCSVEVHFQEIIDGNTPGDFEVVPDSKLVVSRQASRNNTSRYYINNSTSNYSDVTALLRQRGIDLDHKRFLILQGEVESIALMKPKAKDDNDDGLLEYLEDIIGTSKYKDIITQTATRLDEINERRAEKLNRVKFVAKELGSLEDKKREAENYLENENALSRRKNELYQVYRYEAQVNMEVAEKTVEDLKIKLHDEVTKHEEIIQELKTKEEHYEDTTQVFKASEAEHATIMKEHSAFEKQNVEMRARREHAATKKAKDIDAKEKDSQLLAKAEQDIVKHTEDVKKRRKDVKELETQLKDEKERLEEINEELKGNTEEFMTQIDEQQKALQPWNEKLNAKKQAIDVKTSERQILDNKIHAGIKAVEKATAQLESLVKTKARKNDELEALPKEIEEMKSEIYDLEVKCKDAVEREAMYRKDVNVARQKADEARSSMQQSQTRGKVLDALIRMRDSGRITGIHDRMGNLGVIDDKYDVAISTACNSLDNIVVDSVAAAQACIEHLRKNNLGRASFTVLDKLSSVPRDALATPEDVSRLFDLIKLRDPKFAPAFYSVLKDTLVAEDLRQANRIAFGKRRWRVVTLDGKLIERSGAMTGGGGRPSRGAMSSQFKPSEDVSPETVATLEKERDDLERELRDIVEEKRSVELVHRSKRSVLPKKELALEKLQMDARSLDSQIQDDTKRLEELKAEMQPSQQDVDGLAEIDQEIEQLNQDMEDIKSQCAEIEDKIHSLQDDIMDAGGMDLRLQTVVVNDMTKLIEGHHSKITKGTVLKSKAEKDVVKFNKNLSKYDTSLEQLAKEIEDLDQLLIQNNKDADAVLDRAIEAKKIMEQQKKTMDELKAELDQDSAKIDAFKKARLEMTNQMEEYQKSRNDNAKKAEHWVDQQSKLTLHKIWGSSEENMSLPIYDTDRVKEFQNDKQAIKGEIAEIEAFVQSAKPNLSVLEEYRRRDEEYKDRSSDLDAVTKERDAVKNEADSLRKKRLDEFMQGFNIISQKLKEMYQMITLGGNAELELVDSLDPFSEGIVFSVMPPKKSWKNISNLSGGEKTLSSLALVFALHHFKPTPLYVMDEIDAALDFRNVSIVANYIAERTKDAQFVIISLRNNMFELADRLVGIYKTSNCTRSIAINPTMIATLTALGQQDKNEISKQQRAKRTSFASTPKDTNAAPPSLSS